MRRQVSVHPRRRAAVQEQPAPAVPPTRPAADTRTAQAVIDKIDEVLERG